MGKGVPIGLRNVVYALLVDDPAAGAGVASYAAPVLLGGAIHAKINPNSSLDTLFAEDGPFETAATIGQIQLDLNVADLDLDEQGALLGHTVVGGVLKRLSTDVPPWLALGFKSLKSNGSYRFTWLAKGKFSQPQQDNMTKADKISFQTSTANGSFVARDSDGEWERHIDQDHVDYMPTMGTNWFNNPFGGNADVTPPTVVVSPADAAAAVALAATISWTFSEAMALSSLNTDNFAVFADVSEAPVAGVLSVNAGRTVVTFTPTALLTSGVVYRTLVSDGVKDLAGNKLAAKKVTKFTCV